VLKRVKEGFQDWRRPEL